MKKLLVTAAALALMSGSELAGGWSGNNGGGNGGGGNGGGWGGNGGGGGSQPGYEFNGPTNLGSITQGNGIMIVKAADPCIDKFFWSHFGKFVLN